MKVILFGATGMVGQGVLRECLLDPDVEARAGDRAARRRARSTPKLREIVHADFSDFAAVEAELAGYDACFFCLGVSSAGMSEADYRRVTYDFTLAAATGARRAKPRDDVRLRVGRGHRQHRARPLDVGAREGRDRERAAARCPSRRRTCSGPASSSRCTASSRARGSTVRSTPPPGAPLPALEGALPERSDDDRTAWPGDARRREARSTNRRAGGRRHQPRRRRPRTPLPNPLPLRSASRGEGTRNAISFLSS